MLKLFNTLQIQLIRKLGIPGLGKEGNKTIKDLKRQMALMETENINIFNEEEKNLLKKDFQKAFQNKKELEVVLQKTIDDFKR